MFNIKIRKFFKRSKRFFLILLPLISLVVVFVFVYFLSTLKSGSFDIRRSAHESESGNLLVNSGFEEGSGDLPSNWTKEIKKNKSNVEWVSDVVHSGQKAIKLTSTDEYATAGVHSDLFAVTPGSKVNVTLWLKTEDIISFPSSGDFRKLRVWLRAYDDTGQENVANWYLVKIEDPISRWRRVTINNRWLPQDAAFMKIVIELKYCIGTAWVDDVEVTMQEVPSVDTIGVYNPVIIPQPKIMINGVDKLSLGSVAVVLKQNQPYLEQEIESFLADQGINYDVFDNNDNPAIQRYDTKMLIDDNSNSEIRSHFSHRFPNESWSMPNDRIYYISVVKTDTQNKVYLGSRSEVGRFYAFQTTKQLIADGHIYVVDIRDFPRVGIRGTPNGTAWFDNAELLAKRMASLKLNYLWIQGSFLDNKFMTKWRVPLTDAERTILQSSLNLSRSRYIDLFISISPRGKDPRIMYSSDEEIGYIVNKMSDLYSLGFRNFGLSFDDLDRGGIDEGELFYQEDIDMFGNSIAKAHVYFVNQAYARLKQSHPDIKFKVVPMVYQGMVTDSDLDYYREFRSLPREITLFTSLLDDDEVRLISSLSSRKVLVWDNFYSAGEGVIHKPTFLVPYKSYISWFEGWLAGKAEGLTFLPVGVWKEDLSLSSWYTFADLVWSPGSYVPNESFQLAAAKYYGVSDNPNLKVSTPIISPVGKEYRNRIRITIETTTPDAAVYYTTDGNNPSNSSTLYTGSFIIGSSTEVRAKAYRDGYSSSEVAVVEYTIQ